MKNTTLLPSQHNCIHFSTSLGLACIVVFLIFIVHSYVAPTLNELIIIIIIINIIIIIIIIAVNIRNFLNITSSYHVT